MDHRGGDLVRDFCEGISELPGGRERVGGWIGRRPGGVEEGWAKQRSGKREGE